MAAFHSPGDTSSALKADAFKALCASAQSNEIKIIKEALGVDSELYLVGGSVRELILGSHDLTDLDLATKLPPSLVIERAEKAGLRAIPTALKHGTVTLAINAQNIEITTFRGLWNEESSFSDTIEHDLEGRDFTINAMAFSLDRLELVDPFNGLKDLADQLLRATKDPTARFSEDPLRILRSIRFGPASNRRIEDNTAQVAKNLGVKLTKVSPERIKAELTKILLSVSAGAGLRALKDLNLLQFTVPELIASVGFEQNEYHRFDVFEHTLQVVDNCPKDSILRWAALFHDIAKPATLSTDERGMRHFYKHEQLGRDIAQIVMQRLKFSNQEMKSILALVQHHMRPMECGPAGIRRLIRDVGPEFERWQIFKRADALAAKVNSKDYDLIEEQFLKKLEVERSRAIGSVYSSLALNGDDILKLGLKEGIQVGVLLKYLTEKVIEQPDLNQRDNLIAIAREWIESQYK